MNLTFAAQLNKMITAGLGGSVEAPETGVAVGRRVEYTSIGPAPLLTFEANSELHFKALSINIEPIQDLHGQDAPYPGGGGKNLLPMIVENIKTINTAGTWSGNVYTIGNVTYTVNVDNGNNVQSVTVNGTATSYSLLRLCNAITFDVETRLRGCPSSSYSGYRLQAEAENNYQDIGNGAIIPANAAITRIIIAVPTGVSASNVVFYPRMVDNSLSDQSFVPYSNICPISGRSEVNIWREATYDTSAEPAITIQLDDIVYGGSLDVVKGVAVIEWANIASYDGETLPGVWISDRDDYAPGTSPTTGAQVCYKLETPITVQLTSQEITTLIGTNNVWSDAGDLSATYGNIYYTEGY